MGERTMVGNGSGRRPGWELAHGHAVAVGGVPGSRAEILGVRLEGAVSSTRGELPKQ